MTTDEAEPELVVGGTGPIQQQIVEQLRTLILSGRLPAGEQLPTVREMAVQLEINPNLVQHAYAVLQREGFLSSEEGSGIFVANGLHLDRVRQERQGQLEQLCEQFLACAAAQGFAAAEVLRTTETLVQRRSSWPHT